MLTFAIQPGLTIPSHRVIALSPCIGVGPQPHGLRALPLDPDTRHV